MGRAISERQFLRRRQTSYQRPLVFCCEPDGIADNVVSLNVPIAKRLSEISPSMRSIRLEQCFNAVLSALPDDVVIRDIDVLFNPEYQIDVLTLLVSAYRKHRFDIIWPGRYEDGQLVYAEEGFADHRTYDIENYDLTCIY